MIEATLTFAMTRPEGRRYEAQDIKARTEPVLAGRFARIAVVEEALAGPVSLPAAHCRMTLERRRMPVLDVPPPCALLCLHDQPFELRHSGNHRTARARHRESAVRRGS